MWVREWAGDLRLKPKSASDSGSVVERLVWEREKMSEWEEGVWGENKPKAAQHAVVSNKQFAVSISSQPSTWKIWISNLATACYVLWDAERFFMDLCLCLLLAGKWLWSCGFQESSKNPEPGGRCQSPSPAFVLAQGGSEFQIWAAAHSQISPSRCATAPSPALLSTTLILVWSEETEFCPVYWNI